MFLQSPQSHPILVSRQTHESDASGIKINSRLSPEETSSPADFEALEHDMLSKVDLIPPPKDIVFLLKSAERKELTSGVYFRCLQAYQELAQHPDMDEANTK